MLVIISTNISLNSLGFTYSLYRQKRECQPLFQHTSAQIRRGLLTTYTSKGGSVSHYFNIHQLKFVGVHLRSTPAKEKVSAIISTNINSDLSGFTYSLHQQRRECQLLFQHTSAQIRQGLLTSYISKRGSISYYFNKYQLRFIGVHLLSIPAKEGVSAIISTNISSDLSGFTYKLHRQKRECQLLFQHTSAQIR